MNQVFRTSSTTPADQEQGPVLLDPRLLKHVAGGSEASPKGGWYETSSTESPKGGWYQTTDTASPKGGW